MIHMAADLFSMGQSLTQKLGTLAGGFLVLAIGVIAAGHVARHNVGAAIVVILIALIPAWFLFDPAGATSTLKSTVAAL
jgi:hypothetical protein